MEQIESLTPPAKIFVPAAACLLIAGLSTEAGWQTLSSASKTASSVLCGAYFGALFGCVLAVIGQLEDKQCQTLIAHTATAMTIAAGTLCASSVDTIWEKAGAVPVLALASSITGYFAGKTLLELNPSDFPASVVESTALAAIAGGVASANPNLTTTAASFVFLGNLIACSQNSRQRHAGPADV